jgi:hypothetical protein
MAAGPEMRGDHAEHRQEPLGSAGGAESFHGAFAAVVRRYSATSAGVGSAHTFRVARRDCDSRCCCSSVRPYALRIGPSLDGRPPPPVSRRGRVHPFRSHRSQHTPSSAENVARRTDMSRHRVSSSAPGPAQRLGPSSDDVGIHLDSLLQSVPYPCH